ncbi:MAG: DUF4956 domain-containing protein, partial [Clostridiales bacterium]|nr:DUF4956 domain-containing protein [Clostridiales bacterium]
MPNIFLSILGTSLTISKFFICTGFALLCGIIIAFAYSRRTKYTQSYILTLILIPATVQMVIMLVNGNLGTGVAVAGAFSLVRFRSIPGNGKDIAVVFLAMAAGLGCGTGYIGLSVLFILIMCAIMYVIALFKIGAASDNEKELRITIPEELDYSGAFDDLFKEYTKSSELISVRTTNMGSLYKLCYKVML